MRRLRTRPALQCPKSCWSVSSALTSGTLTGPTVGPLSVLAKRALLLNPLPADAQQCPPDVEEIAEAYCMEKLDNAQRIASRSHNLVCERCRSIVANTDQFISRI